MTRAIGWICGSAIILGFGAANAVGYCLPQATKYSHEDAILFALQDAAKSRSYIIPDIATIEDARKYFQENPECCGLGRIEKPLRSVFGLFKGAYGIELPRKDGPENLYAEFSYEMTNCLSVIDTLRTSYIKK